MQTWKDSKMLVRQCSWQSPNWKGKVSLVVASEEQARAAYRNPPDHSCCCTAAC